jgi:hypothetical protein
MKLTLTRIIIGLVVVYILYRIFYVKEGYNSNDSSAIIGGSVGGTLGVLAIVGAIVYFWLKSKTSSAPIQNFFSDNPDDW